MRVFTPPTFPSLDGTKSVFLAGSIEMGAARNWQEEFIKDFISQTRPLSIEGEFTILNPRRPDWDSTWKQEIQDANFFQQVTWEMDYLTKADHRVFYFAKDTISPISLLELGIHTMFPNNYVIIEDGYKRRGNVEITCSRFDIPIFKTTHDLISKIIEV